MNDGPGWSPDGGKFWKKGDKLYWHDGEVTNANLLIRVGMSGTSCDHEDYSAWSDEKRAAIFKETQSRWEAAAKEEKRELEIRNTLRASARLKLTAEEIKACDLEYDEY